MAKHRSTGVDIYIISLDTFMLMAILGITLGIIFFLINPTLVSQRPTQVTAEVSEKAIQMNAFLAAIDATSDLIVYNSALDRYSRIRQIRKNELLKFYNPKTHYINLALLNTDSSVTRPDTIILRCTPLREYAGTDSIKFKWYYNRNGVADPMVSMNVIMEIVSQWPEFYSLFTTR